MLCWTNFTTRNAEKQLLVGPSIAINRPDREISHLRLRSGWKIEALGTQPSNS